MQRSAHMKILAILGSGLLVAAVTLAPVLAQEDEPGSKDHPLFSRMQGYFISNYYERDFDSAEFPAKNGAMTTVEGRKTYIGYRLKDGVSAVSPLQAGRNYQNALAKVGGTVLYQEVGPGGGQTAMKLVRGTSEVWVLVNIGDSGNNYKVPILAKGGMERAVAANA